MTELIVALDGDVAHAGAVFSGLYRELGHRWFKIGPQALLQHSGMIFIRNMMRESDVQLMLDLKLYDTVDTVKAATRYAFDLGAKFLTVYAAPSVMTAALSVVKPKNGSILAIGKTSDDHGAYGREVDRSMFACDRVVLLAAVLRY